VRPSSPKSEIRMMDDHENATDTTPHDLPEAAQSEPEANPYVPVILTMVAERGASKSICPSEVARAMAGQNEKEWRLLMKPIRAAAVALANEGGIAITRKGKPVDPNAFKGVYRLTLPV